MTAVAADRRSAVNSVTTKGPDMTNCDDADSDPLAIVSDNRGVLDSGAYIARLRNGMYRAGCDNCGWTGNILGEHDAMSEYIAHECGRSFVTVP